MSSLNIDCLAAICKKLDWEDQIKFACTSSLCADAFIMNNSVQLRSTNVAVVLGDLPLEEQQIFLSRIGRYLGTMSLTEVEVKQPIFNLVCKFCKNVTNLHLFGIKCRHCVLSLCNEMEMITQLEFFSCDITDDELRYLQVLSNLKQLSLKCNHKITGKYVHELKTVQNLSVMFCFNIETIYIIEIIKSLVDLHTLTLRDGPKAICEEVYRQLSQHSHKLETLTIDSKDTGLELLANLPALKSLTVVPNNNETFLPRQLIDKLAKLKAHQLKFLEITDTFGNITIDLRSLACLTNLKILRCCFKSNPSKKIVRALTNMKVLEEVNLSRSRISNLGLLELLSKCKRIHTINIQYCFKITDECILEAIRLLGWQKWERTTPVTLRITGSCITRGIFEDPRYIQAAEEDLIYLIQ